uniref:Chromosome 2 open reading frame 68 n=1 Tax=Anolis carolinensis TaxID=28377 RepID=A0A803TJ25_ANOCA
MSGVLCSRTLSVRIWKSHSIFACSFSNTFAGFESHQFFAAGRCNLRDDYDREVKQAKEKVKKRHTPAPARPRKPDQPVYHPCRRAPQRIALQDSGRRVLLGLDYEGSSESSSGTDPDVNGPPLFCLDFEADSGKITSVVVHQEHDPEDVVEKVSAQDPLEPALREALRRRVQEELEKRRVKR